MCHGTILVITYIERQSYFVPATRAMHPRATPKDLLIPWVRLVGIIPVRQRTRNTLASTNTTK